MKTCDEEMRRRDAMKTCNEKTSENHADKVMIMMNENVFSDARWHFPEGDVALSKGMLLYGVGGYMCSEVKFVI
jgi:hypothetical protein